MPCKHRENSHINLALESTYPSGRSNQRDWLRAKLIGILPACIRIWRARHNRLLFFVPGSARLKLPGSQHIKSTLRTSYSNHMTLTSAWIDLLIKLRRVASDVKKSLKFTRTESSICIASTVERASFRLLPLSIASDAARTSAAPIKRTGRFDMSDDHDNLWNSDILWSCPSSRLETKGRCAWSTQRSALGITVMFGKTVQESGIGN